MKHAFWLAGLICIFSASNSYGYDWSTNPGDGSEGNPYQVSEPEHLIAIGSNLEQLDKHYILVRNIEFDPNNNPDHFFSTAVIAPDLAPTINKRDFQGIPFTGSFDGNGFCISNLKIESSGSYAGLFGCIQGQEAPNRTVAVKDILFVNSWVSTSSDHAGILAGEVRYSSIERCSVQSGMVKGDDNSGGLIGYITYSHIRDCNVQCTVIGTTTYSSGCLGGLIGSNLGGTITGSSAACSVQLKRYGTILGGLIGKNISGAVANCYASVSAEGIDHVGGLIGWNESSTVSNSYASGSIYGNNDVGGLVGFNTASHIMNCFAISNVDGRGSVGGLVGANDGGTIKTCFASGSVHGHIYNPACIGGLVGNNICGLIAHCYATGPVGGDLGIGGLVGLNQNGSIGMSYATGLVNGTEFVGGLIGHNISGVTILSYWDKDSSNCATSDGGIGRTSAEMRTRSTFQGWGDKYWTLDDSSDTPHLIWEKSSGARIVDIPRSYGGGSGTLEDPFQLWTAEQLQTIAYYPEDLDKHFVLKADLLLDARENFQSIGTKGFPFEGTFDGGNHMITNFNIQVDRVYYLGLFGCVATKATEPEHSAKIENLQLVNPHVNFTGSYAACLVAFLNSATVQNCRITGGSVKGTDDSSYLAGLIGYSINGFICNCSVECTTEGGDSSEYLGGLIGRAEKGSIIHCETSGCIKGDNYSGYMGGLIGSNSAAIVHACTSSNSAFGDKTLGGLIGCNIGGNISDSHATGMITGQDDSYFGGLIAYNKSAVVMNCSAAGDVTGRNFLGGLIGKNEDGVILACRASGVLHGQGQVGGLVGNNTSGVIDASAAKGAIHGSRYVGGFVGDHAGGMINRCFAEGDVTGWTSSSSELGGFVGRNTAGIIANCYAKGDTSGINHLGGFAGVNFGEMHMCYSLGQAMGSYAFGGFTGGQTSEGRITDCYFLNKPEQENGFGIPLNEVEANFSSTYVGWDFTGESVNGDHEIWRMCVDGVDYPRLSWEFAAGGDFACPDGVGVDDLAAVAEHWMTVEAGNPGFNYAVDGNGDGRVDLVEMGILSRAWGQ